MGTTCPQCGLHKAFIKMQTLTGAPPNKPEDIISRTLECGHEFGTAEFNEYLKQVREIEIKYHRAIKDAKDTIKKEASRIWVQISTGSKRGGSQ